MDLKHSRCETDDRRKYTRYQLSVSVQLSMTDHPTIQGQTIEISEGGFGATISTLLEVGHSSVCYTNRVQRDVGRGTVDSWEGMRLRIPGAKLGTTANDQRPSPQAAVALQRLRLLAPPDDEDE
jgi:hypothetical protein